MNASTNEAYKNMWDARYAANEYAYGKAPNAFFREQLTPLQPGQLLMPADGEGRNGVYAAQLGWDVTAFDLSVEGKNKAFQLAQEQGVSIQYLVGELHQLSFTPASFDAIGLIYAHFSASQKSAIHQQLTGLLKPGGLVIFEAFSKAHLSYLKANPKVGGPKELGMLFSKAEIEADFHDFEPLLLEETEIQLNEGAFHMGTGSVIRFVGRKV